MGGVYLPPPGRSLRIRYAPGMRMKWGGVLGVGLLHTLTGCSQSVESQVQDMCVKAAAEKAGAAVTTSDVKVANIGDVFYNAGITDSKDTDEKNATFTMLSTVKWSEGTIENRREMTCTVAFKDGQPDLQIDFG